MQKILLVYAQQPFVVSVDALYGMGKTFFLNRWQEQLRKDGYQVAFFNAWNTDWEKEPLIPFIKTIIDSFPQDISDIIKEKSRGLLRSIKNYGNLIIECAGGPEDALGKLTQIINPDNKIEQYEAKQKIINDFKNIICEKIKGNKLFIFVDELERCRPTYAIEVLETIKHIFDIPNVIFILGIDRTQLKHTISTLYGSDMDGEGYLKRFVDLELHLPKPDRNAFCKVLMKKFAIKNKNSADSNSIINGWDCYCNYNNIAIPLHGAVERVSLYQPVSDDVIFDGDKNCTSARPCLNNLKLDEIHKACSACNKSKEVCSVTLFF